jgi:hypothetical protein
MKKRYSGNATHAQLRLTGVVVVIALIFGIVSECAGQRIKESELDPFIKKYRIETSYVQLRPGLFKYLTTKLRSVDKIVFLQLFGSGNYVVGEDSQLIFLFDDESTMSLSSKGMQYSTISSEPSFAFEYRINPEEVRSFQDKIIKGVRLYTTSSYIDYKIDPEDAYKMKKLSTVFLKEFAKVKSATSSDDQSTSSEYFKVGEWVSDNIPVVRGEDNESGRLTFELQIDNRGDLISYKKHSGTLSASTERACIEVIQKIKFEKDSEAKVPEITTGQITFVVRGK